jgi:hypothetical protein
VWLWQTRCLDSNDRWKEEVHSAVLSVLLVAAAAVEVGVVVMTRQTTTTTTERDLFVVAVHYYAGEKNCDDIAPSFVVDNLVVNRYSVVLEELVEHRMAVGLE